MKYNHKIVLFLILGLVLIHIFSASAIKAENLTLKDILESGLKNNSEIIKNKLEYRIANNELRLAEQNLYPEVNLESSYTRMEEGPKIMTPQFTFEEGPKENYNTKVTMKQPIYAGGRIRLGVEQAENSLELVRIQNQQQTADTLMQVIEAYYNVLLARDRVKIEKDALALVKEHRRMTRVSYEVGTAIKTDLLQVEIEESKAKQRLVKARNQLWLAKKRLANLIGKEAVFTVEESELQPSFKLDFADLYQKALKNRPELLSLDINREMTETNLELKKKSHYPSFYLMGNYSWQDDELSFADGSWNLTLTGSISIFDGGKSVTEKAKINNQLAQIEETCGSLEQMIELEIRQKLMEIEENQNDIDVQNLNLNKARENLRLENRRFEAGVGKSVDVLSAQTTLKQTRIARSQARYKYEKSLFSLLYKTGSLLDYVREVINNE